MKNLLSTLCLLCLTTIATASGLIDVQVLDRSSGCVLETWRHQGRLYVVGTPGERYAVLLRNRSGGRVLTVLSVDGVNAVSGQTAVTSQSGYVLASGQSIEVAGWRKNLDEVAAFYFNSLGDSYAARTGRPQNVGVIGVAVFREYEPPRLRYEERDIMDSSAGTATSSPSSPRMEAQKSRAAEERLGTGHGERLNSRVDTTEFRRASESPVEILGLYYDSRANLEAQGIIPPRRSRHPEPFPGGFAPDPIR